MTSRGGTGEYGRAHPEDGLPLGSAHNPPGAPDAQSSEKTAKTASFSTFRAENTRPKAVSGTIYARMAEMVPRRSNIFHINPKVQGHRPWAALASPESLKGDRPQGDHSSGPPERRAQRQCGWPAITKRPSGAPERVARVTARGGAGECDAGHPEDRLPPEPASLPSCGKRDPRMLLSAACKAS